MKTRLLASTARSPLWLAALPLSLTAALPAQAQDGNQDASASSDSGNDNIIIVTAQRREQDLQDVPAAVTALSGAALEARQIADTNDLQNQIPNVVISTGTGTASSARIFFRGIGEDESRGAIDPAVGIYVDNVYLGRTVGSLVDLVDIDQVEVLRGPQGTLYGRNTNGGAIKISSVRPQIGETSLSGEIGGGNHDRLMGRATINLSAGDSMAFRLSGLYKRRDGFVTLNPNGDFANIAGTEAGDEDVLAFRGSWYGELSDRWSFLAIADYTRDKSQPVPASIVAQSDNPTVVTDADGDIYTAEPAPGVTCSALTPASFQPVGCFTNYFSEVDAFGVSYELTGDYDTFTVTSTTAYRTLDDELSSHISFPFTQQTEQNQFSQELLLNTNFDGAFNFVTGAYYYTEEATLDSVFIFPFNVNVETESFALFGQVYADIGALGLTGGLRWTTEDRTVVGNAGGPLAGFGTGITRNFDTDNVTWTVKADYDLTEDLMVYASYATGFKTPGASPDCFSPAACFLPVAEENLDSIEAGLRARFADGRGTFNATYFYNDYQDLQISGTLPTGGFTRVNAGEARIQGVELEASFEPIDGFTVYGNASWLDAQYRALNFTQAAVLTGSSTTAAGPTCAGANPANANYQQQIVDCALDLSLKNAPEFKALVGFNYEFFAGGGTIFLGADGAWEDDSFGLVANPPGSLIEPGFRLDARIGWRAENERWKVTLWGKNLTDREYFRATTGANNVYPAPPLTFGVDVGFKFD